MKGRHIVLVLLALFAAVACNSCAPQPSPVPPSPPEPVVVVDAGPTPPPAPPVPPPVVVVDAGPEPVIDRSVKDACASLAAAGCAEGVLPMCLVKLQQAINDRLTREPVPLACLVGAHTKPAVHACGKFVPCL